MSRRKWKCIIISLFFILILFNSTISCYASGYRSWVQGSDLYDDLYGGIEDNIFDQLKEKIAVKDSWISAALGEVLNGVVIALWWIVDKAGMTIDHIILGKLYKNHSGIGMWQFALDDNNPYGITVGIVYNSLLNIAFPLWILCALIALVICLMPNKRSGEKWSRYKNALLDSIIVMLGFYLMPQLVDFLIFFRDSITSFLLQNLQNETNSTTVSILECFASISITNPSLTNTILFLIAIMSCFWFGYDYIKRACMCTGYYLLFIFINIMSIFNFNKDVIKSWLARMFGNLIIPLMDAILLMIPIVYMKIAAISMSNTELSEAIVALFMYMCLMPARNEVLEMLKLKASSRGRNPLMQLALLASLGMTGGSSAGALAGNIAASGSAATAAAAGAEAATNAAAANMTNAVATGTTAGTAIEGPSLVALDGVTNIGEAEELGMADTVSEGFNPNQIGTSLEEVAASDYDSNPYMPENASQTGEEISNNFDTMEEIKGSGASELEQGMLDSLQSESMANAVGIENETNIGGENGNILSPREENLVKMDQTNKEINDLQGQIMKDKESEPVQRLQDNNVLAAMESERVEAISSNRKLKDDIGQLENKNEHMQRKNEEIRANSKPLDEKSVKQLERNEKLIEQNQESIAAKRAEMDSNNQKIEELNSKIGQKRSEMAQRESDKIHAQNQLKNAQNRLEGYKERERAFAKENEMNGLNGNTYQSHAAYQIQAARDNKMKQLATYQNFDNQAYRGVLTHKERAEFYQERMKAEQERRSKQLGIMMAAGTAGLMTSAIAGSDEAITTAAATARMGMVFGRGSGNKVVTANNRKQETNSANIQGNQHSTSQSVNKEIKNSGNNQTMNDLYEELNRQAQPAEDILNDVIGRKG